MLAKRVQTQLDALCLEFIHQATLVVATRNPQSLIPSCAATCVLALGNREAGDTLLQHTSADSLLFTLPAQPNSWGPGPDDSQSGQLSLYFLVTGVGHGLRVNGHYHIHEQGDQRLMTVRVATAYLHCARAASRGDLWQTVPGGTVQAPAKGLAALLSECRYCLLHTSNAKGDSQLSPRGDPAGFMHLLDDGHLFLAERPGNKVAVSLSNLLEQPAVAIAGLFPGQPGWLELAGTACISDSPQMLDRCIVAGKRPQLGVLLSLDYWSWHQAPALSAPSLWTQPTDESATPVVTPFSRALAQHMQGTGLMGKVVHKVVDTVVKRDMKRLY